MKQRIVIVSLLAVVMLGAAGTGLYRAGRQQGLQQGAQGDAATSAPAGMTMAAGSNAAARPESGGTPAGAALTAATAAMPALTKEEPAAAPAASERKILYWHDPMVPSQKFDKPGKSPFMDMQLVPVYADDGGNDRGLQISNQAQQNFGMRTAVAGTGHLAAAIEAVGTVAYNERDVAVIQARSNGFVERLFVRAPLDAVRRGQPLAALYVPEWQAAQEEYLSVRRMGTAAPAGLLDAARGRMRLAGMPDDLVAQVVSSGQARTRMTLTAPIAGIVTELSAREGMTVVAGAPLFRINGLATVWLNAEVPEDAAARLRPGNPVEARTAALPGTVFNGRVGAILPEINAVTRTIRARIEVANPAGQLIPGMFASVRLTPPSGAEVVTVPSEAVIRTGTRSVVMLVQPDNGFIPVDVETGAEANGLTEIRKGVASGQKVVVSGQFLIDSEASLKGFGARTGAMAPSATMPQMTAGATMPQTTARAASPSAPAEPPLVHHGVGRIESIAPDAVTISHGPVASLQWGPMTMGFRPPKAGLPKGVAVGDTVGFDFLAAPGGSFQITALAPAAAAPQDRQNGHVGSDAHDAHRQHQPRPAPAK